MTLVDLRGRVEEPSVRALLQEVDAPEQLRAGAWAAIGWEDAGELVGVAGVERIDGDEVALRAVAVTAPHRRRGVGRELVSAIVSAASARRVVADVPAGCEDFYERCGFAVDAAAGAATLEIALEPAPPEAVSAATLSELEAAIRASWGADTADDPEGEWSPENPAVGQCGVTALLVRELLGGEILVAPVLDGERPAGRHAWNRLPSGVAIDLTRSQFVRGERLGAPEASEPVVTTIASEEYKILSERVRALLGR
jgi:predicted N-acetyltransferase YhbS